MARSSLAKAPTGIGGLDEITAGGFPRGRTTLMCGGPGCGKTLMGLQFLVRGIIDHDEPGVLLCFEESAQELAENVASLGWDLDGLQADGKLIVDAVRLDPAEIQVTGAWDLDGLLIRLDSAIAEVGAQRVVIDTIEVLFGAFGDDGLLRAELRRLFRWLNDRGVSAVVTAERGDGTLTRHGLEEYVSDCVVVLDHRAVDQVLTRRLRILKYRGSAHGPDEYPFLIERDGFTVIPITSMGLAHAVSSERISLGVEAIDEMLSGGMYRGSTLLITGTPGAGKSTFAGTFLQAACARGERALLFTYEESPAQVVRNLASVGLDLGRWCDEGLLEIVAARPASAGLEGHLVELVGRLNHSKPVVVALDPMTALGGEPYARAAMLGRFIDICKERGITALLTALVSESGPEPVDVGVSSVVDTAIVLRNLESGGERNRSLDILKSRGVAHSNQVREFRLTPAGVTLEPPFEGEPVLMGTARKAQEAREDAEVQLAHDVAAGSQRRWERRRAELEAQIAALGAEVELAAGEHELEQRSTALRDARSEADQRELLARRGGAQRRERPGL